MAESPQNYENHTRRHPLHHFFVVPLLLLNLVYSIAQLTRHRDLEHAWPLALAFGLLGLATVARLSALRVQDRLIRLEERLRYHATLPPALARRADALPLGQIVALRFAPDDELPGLVQQVLDGKLTKSKDIKRAIRHWRADTLRV